MEHRRERDDPTLLLVHGAFDGAWVWEPVLDPLRARGVRVEAIERLPSAGTDPSALGDLGDDAEQVRARVDQIAGRVVLCGHSYGGMVITQLADHPAVIHSVYVAALWPVKGQSVIDLLGGGALPGWVVDRGDGSFAVSDDVEAVRQALFADVDPERAADAHARMVLQSAASSVAPSGAPSRLHPTTYVLCSEDRVLPLEAQEAMAAAADHTVRLHSAHCPQLSAPEQLADVLAETVLGSRAGVANLILDLLEWMGPEPRPYAEVLEAWRTTCPRLPVWEDANDRGFIARRHVPGRGALVSLSAAGAEHPRRHREPSDGFHSLDGP